METMADSDNNSSNRRRRRRSNSKCAKLFFCFNSCFFSSSSSSSMKISRSILSPARHKDHPFSLSSSLTRRLTSNGSIKGAQSPFYPTTTTAAAAATSKKRGGATLDNPEPSSPKVTCIGQVRVKSKKKKHGRKLRTPSRRRSGGADGSFRRSDNWGSADLNCKQASFTENRHRTQRWVHLPLTICQGLKGSCCFSSSSSRERESKREKIMRSDLEVEEQEEIEIGREKFEQDKLDVEEEVVQKEEDEDEEEGEGRLSFSVPPKNALLLMRCRSDPMRVAALSRRLLESPLLPDGMNLEGGEEESDPVDDVGGGEINEESEAVTMVEDEEKHRETEQFDEDDSIMDGQKEEEHQEEEEEDSEKISSTMAEDEEEEEKEVYADSSLSAAAAVASEEEEEEARESASSVRSDSESNEDLEKESTKEIETVKVKATGERIVGSEEEEEEEETLDRENETGAGDGDGAMSVLPDCLLLMMREPKVSMEVSKETWVCSTDFKRILPERRRPATNKTLPAGDEDPTTKNNNKRVDGALSLSSSSSRAPKPAAVKQRQQTQKQQAGRSSCSLPGPISTAEKLPRCKSEPRTAAAKLMAAAPSSETCMWKSRKVEQLRRSTAEVVGPAAGVGF